MIRLALKNGHRVIVNKYGCVFLDVADATESMLGASLNDRHEALATASIHGYSLDYSSTPPRLWRGRLRLTL